MVRPNYTLSLLPLLLLACRAERRTTDTRTPTTPPTRVAHGPIATPVSVTEHHVGPIPLDSSFSYLAAHFPGFHADTGYVEETSFPTWTFTVSGVTATAWHTYRVTDSTQGPDMWTVTGSGILLADSVAMPPTWGELRARFPGRATLAFDDLGYHVEVCALPGLTFFLDFPDGKEDPDTMSVASVPRSALILQIGIYPRRPYLPGSPRDQTCSQGAT